MNNHTIKSRKISRTADSFTLNFLIREPAAPQAQKKAVILLHGVGSSEQDLFMLADRLPDDFYIISARGPFTLSVGRYAWYNVSFSSGKPIFDGEQELSSRAAIAQFIRQLKEDYHFEKIYLGGFSQGAIMSYSTALTLPEVINGVFSFSGRILDEIKPLAANSTDLKNLKIFIAHGVQDNTLPIHYARQAKAYLESLELQLNYHEYNMGHQITQEVLWDFREWLEA